MKKFFIPFMAIALVACNNESTDFIEVASESFETTSTNSNLRSLKDAINIANEAITQFEGETSTRASRTKVADVNDISVIKSSSTRSSNSDPLLYVVNYEANQGFAVISANPNTEALLAYVEKGRYSDEVLSEGNGGFNEFMQLALSFAEENPADILNESSEIDDQDWEVMDVMDTTFSSMNPILEVEWGQDSFFGRYASNGLAGCVAVTVSQIMSYFEWPQYMWLSYSGRPVDVIYCNWSTIKNYHSVYNHPENCEGIKDDIAILLRQVGEDTNSSYTSNGTGSSINKAKTCLSNWGYSTSIHIGVPSVSVKPSHSCLIYIRGDDVTSGGHSWVYDGYKEWRYRLRTYVRLADNPNSDWELRYEDNDYRTYMHFNWGWHGDFNGYFLKNVYYDPYSQYSELDYSRLFFFGVPEGTIFRNNLKYMTVSHGN